MIGKNQLTCDPFENKALSPGRHNILGHPKRKGSGYYQSPHKKTKKHEKDIKIIKTECVFVILTWKVMKGAQHEQEAPAQLSDIITKADNYI